MLLSRKCPNSPIYGLANLVAVFSPIVENELSHDILSLFTVGLAANVM